MAPQTNMYAKCWNLPWYFGSVTIQHRCIRAMIYLTGYYDGRYCLLGVQRGCFSLNEKFWKGMLTCKWNRFCESFLVLVDNIGTIYLWPDSKGRGRVINLTRSYSFYKTCVKNQCATGECFPLVECSKITNSLIKRGFRIQTSFLQKQ